MVTFKRQTRKWNWSKNLISKGMFWVSEKLFQKKKHWFNKMYWFFRKKGSNKKNQRKWTTWFPFIYFSERRWNWGWWLWLCWIFSDWWWYCCWIITAVRIIIRRIRKFTVIRRGSIIIKKLRKIIRLRWRIITIRYFFMIFKTNNFCF